MSLEEPQGDVPSTLPFPVAFQINALVIFLPARKTQLECFFGSLVFICFYPADDLSLLFQRSSFFLIYYTTDKSESKPEACWLPFEKKRFQVNTERTQ